MADKRNPNSHQGLLHGIIIRSTVESGKIQHITLPELDSRFVVIAPRDIGGTNRVRALANSMPLLTSSTISYKGQPIIALFGPDNESTRLAARAVTIEYEEPEQEETEAEQAHHSGTPYTYSFGSLEEVTAREGLKILERTYEYGSLGQPTSTLSKITTEYDGQQLYISTPTQWPHHVRDTVSDVTGIPKRRVLVDCQSLHSPYDEMLITPSVYAAITALAAIKGSSTAQLLGVIESRHPEMQVIRKSWYSEDGKVHAEKIKVTVDQGSALFFSDEMANHLIAGLTPIYELDAISISITFTTSNRHPAHFFGDLGYSDSLSSTEAHYNVLSKLSGYNPATWRLKHTGDEHAHALTIKTERSAKLKQLVEEVSQNSDYLRKHAAYEMQAQMKVKLSTFLNYSRGIGLACAAGISGFSSECKQLVQQAVQITLNPNDKVEVNTSLPSDGASAQLWKKIISEELSVEEADISFISDCSQVIDSGPAVLSAAVGCMPYQIKRACDLIKDKRFVQPLPIVESVLSSRQSGPTVALFTSNTWVVIALELEIDTILLEPIVRSIWVSISIPKPQNEQIIYTKARRSIVRALREAGGNLTKRTVPTIEINITSDGEQLTSSIASAVRAAVASAFLSAVEQALGTAITKLPVDGNVILAALKGKS
ncbi:MAG: molybdopterin-dependent oxidoreductase [Spirochaetales bacterium]|nr:molybdopterin-dependent oxidoreductase [Spirochaetales bacterium]